MIYFTLLYIIVAIQLVLPICDWLGSTLTIVLSILLYLVIFIVMGHSIIIISLLMLLFIITTPYPRKPLTDYLSEKLGNNTNSDNGNNDQSLGARIMYYFFPF